MRDMYHNIKPVRVISPADNGPAGDAPIVGQIVDNAGFNALTYIVETGTIDDTNATFTTLLEEGAAANLSDAAAVADEHMLGTEALASFTYADDDKVKKLGYIGSKQFTRMTITPSGLGTAQVAALSVCAVLALPSSSPVLT
jgi:hypothetical protein